MSAKRKKKYQGTVVTHTHWDREWYLSVEEYRFRLVELIDRLLDILDDNPDYHSFWFDGQTIPIEDYLEVRPENKERLTTALKEKRILIGPWYVLADEFLVAGEACIRNLLIGTQRAAEYGQDNKIGYLPDTFGHIDQMPQILNGFGIDNAIFWRGLLPDEIDASETIWTGLDGTPVKAVWLVAGYSNARGITIDLETTADRVDANLEIMKKYAKSRKILFMNGIDHALPFADLPAVIEKLGKRYPEVDFRHGSIAEYLESISSEHAKHRVLANELMYVPRLDCCTSNRPEQKKLNRALENRLIHYAEPLTVLAGTRAICPGFLERAWKLLIKCHPHDSICGCHADTVARDLQARLVRGLEIADQVVERTVSGLVKNKPSYSFSKLPSYLAVYNPTPWTRSETIETTIHLPQNQKDFSLKITDEQGNDVEFQVVSYEDDCRRVFSDYIIPGTEKAITAKVLLFAEDLAPMTISRFKIETCTTKVTNVLEATSSINGKNGYFTVQSGAPDILENDLIKLKLHRDGSFDLEHKITGDVFEKLNQLVIEPDNGDLYTFCPDSNLPKTGTTAGSIAKRENVMLRQSAVIKTTLCIHEMIIPVVVKISIDNNSDNISVKTEIDNQAHDFRLQAVFPITGAGTGRVHTPFSLSERESAAPEFSQDPQDNSLSYTNRVAQPMHYLAQFDLKNGNALSIANRGLYEYTWEHPDRPRITLMRAIGKILECLTPHPAHGGQCQGKHSFEYSVRVNKKTDKKLAIKQAFEYNLLPYAQQCFVKPAKGKSAIEFSNPCWMPAALKKRENGQGFVLRFWNASDKEQTGKIQVGLPFKKACLAKMDETLGDEIIFKNGTCKLTIEPFKIITIGFER